MGPPFRIWFLSPRQWYDPEDNTWLFMWLRGESNIWAASRTWKPWQRRQLCVVHRFVLRTQECCIQMEGGIEQRPVTKTILDWISMNQRSGELFWQVLIEVTVATSPSLRGELHAGKILLHFPHPIHWFPTERGACWQLHFSHDLIEWRSGGVAQKPHLVL